MNLESLRRNKVRAAVSVLVVLAVVGGAYLAFADDEPVEISNAEELEQIRESPSGDYVLMDDIDVSHIDNFEPIGSRREPFTGTFDGNGHTISGLTINWPGTDGVGMFRVVSEDTRYFDFVKDEGTIRNLRLEEVNVTGDESVGGLVGVNGGTVTESYVEGDVAGESKVGAVAGHNSGEVTRARAEGDVEGKGRVGGLIGSNARSEIVESHADVNVSGNERVGGLVGQNDFNSVIADSYATGDVFGERVGGGLVGVNTGRTGFTASEVRNSYATGTVSGEGAGLVGMNSGDDAAVSDSYWDINSTGQNESAGGTGLTTSEMSGSAARENMEGFDFGETWQTKEDDYPRLAWQDEESDPDRTAE